MSQHSAESSRGERFAFGENWSKYIETLTPERIAAATHSLRKMLGVEGLRGKSFLDVGSGSGLFSLAARSLGARVHSFDYDPKSVECTRALKTRWYRDDPSWTVDEGSALDQKYLATLGTFDVVYSWGVLHHTGAMWTALENVTSLVAPDGTLWIAIYNDQGRSSGLWKSVKRMYCASPKALKHAIVFTAFARLWGPTMIRDAARGKPGRTWRDYQDKHERGMSPWRDVVDWVGGYPFEVALPEQIFDFFRQRGFDLTRLKTCGGGIGCNEYVFKREIAR